METMMPFLRMMKNYAQRSSNYLGIANFVLIVYLVLQDKLALPFAVIVLVTSLLTAVVLFVVGWADKNFGFLSSDVEYHDRNNPVMDEVLERLERIEDAVKK